METLIAAAIGAALYRARGMGLWPSRPWWQMAFAVPFALVAGGAGPGCFDLAACLIVLATTTAALLTGHASYIDLGSVATGASNAPSDGETEEWYGGWVPFTGYWHDFAGLAVSGVLVTASSGVALILGGDFLLGTALFFSGAVKPLGYALGWFCYERKLFLISISAIAVGETVTGGLLWGAVALISGGVS